MDPHLTHLNLGFMPDGIAISLAAFEWLKQTDRPRYSICSNRPHLASAEMLSKRWYYL